MDIMRGIRALLREVDEAVFPSNIYCLCCGSLIDKSRPYSICDFCMEKIHWITGPTCARCGKALPERISALEETGGAGCADDPATGETFSARGEGVPAEADRLCYDCLRIGHRFVRGFSCVTYGLHEREIMMGLKYSGMGYIAAKCGDMMFDRMEEEIRRGLFSPGQRPIDLVVSVPVSEERLRKRGYNQSAWMARQLVRRWREFVREERGSGFSPADRIVDGHCTPVVQNGTRRFPDAEGVTKCSAPVLTDAAVHRVPTWMDVLERAKATKMLRSLSPAERALELRDAFCVRPSCRGRLDGRRVLLIDDIYTTGATADACSQVLLGGGASEVYVLTWASGGNRRPGEQ